MTQDGCAVASALGAWPETVDLDVLPIHTADLSRCPHRPYDRHIVQVDRTPERFTLEELLHFWFEDGVVEAELEKEKLGH